MDRDQSETLADLAATVPVAVAAFPDSDHLHLTAAASGHPRLLSVPSGHTPTISHCYHLQDSDPLQNINNIEEKNVLNTIIESRIHEFISRILNSNFFFSRKFE